LALVVAAELAVLALDERVAQLALGRLSRPVLVVDLLP